MATNENMVSRDAGLFLGLSGRWAVENFSKNFSKMVLLFLIGKCKLKTSRQTSENAVYKQKRKIKG